MEGLNVEIIVREDGADIVKADTHSFDMARTHLESLERFYKKHLEEEEKWRCPECGEVRIGDDRVANGMKCGHCAY